MLISGEHNGIKRIIFFGFAGAARQFLKAEVSMKKTQPRHALAAAALIAAVLMFADSSQACSEDCRLSQTDILSQGEKMMLDALLIRPLSLATTIAGTAVYGVSLPFSLLAGNEAEARRHLLNEPARYTFKRPLGKFD